MAATPEVSTTTPLPLTPRDQEAAASVARRRDRRSSGARRASGTELDSPGFEGLARMARGLNRTG